MLVVASLYFGVILSYENQLEQRIQLLEFSGFARDYFFLLDLDLLLDSLETFPVQLVEEFSSADQKQISVLLPVSDLAQLLYRQKQISLLKYKKNVVRAFECQLIKRHQALEKAVFVFEAKSFVCAHFVGVEYVVSVRRPANLELENGHKLSF